MDLHNLTITQEPPQWQNGTNFKMPHWGEPLLIVTILFSSMYLTRRRNYSIFPRSTQKRTTYNSYLDDPSSPDFHTTSSDRLLNSSQSEEEHDDEDTLADSLTTTSSSSSSLSTITATTTRPLNKYPPQTRRILFLTITTPNTTRFTHNLHSRLLAKFPFLIEMFYWAITYGFYRLAHHLTNLIFTTAVIPTSQSHGLSILALEQFSPLSPLFPIPELTLQQYFLLPPHQPLLRLLNHTYSLLHIPLTAAFIAFYYHAAPSPRHFATFRRTLTLENLLAFLIFTLYPTMPPRLLPAEYGFRDTVHEQSAGSVWMRDSSNFVNSLAAMPSMHFGYAVVIGGTLVYHSQFWRLGRGNSSSSSRGRHELFHRSDDEHSDTHREKPYSSHAPRLPPPTLLPSLLALTLGLLYPALILLAIIATANHYWLDAVAAVVVCAVGFGANEVLLVLLPVEDWLSWALRVRKPAPSTGEGRRGWGWGWKKGRGGR